MRCHEVMRVPAHAVGPRATAEECAQLMREAGTGFMPVVDEQGLVLGVVTDRDLTLRVLAAHRPASTPVSLVMSPGPFISCRPEDDLLGLEQRMGNARRSRALVQDATGRLVGIISLSDIAQVERSPARVGIVVREVTDRESSILSDLD